MQHRTRQRLRHLRLLPPRLLACGVFSALLLIGCVTSSEDHGEPSGWNLSDEPHTQAPAPEPDTAPDIDPQQVVVHRHEDRIPGITSGRRCEGDVRARHHRSMRLRFTLSSAIPPGEETCELPTEYAPYLESGPYDLYIRFPSIDPRWHKFEVRQRYSSSVSDLSHWMVELPSQNFQWRVLAWISYDGSLSIAHRTCEPSAVDSSQEFDERYGNVEMRVEQQQTGIIKNLRDYELYRSPMSQWRIHMPLWGICAERL